MDAKKENPSLRNSLIKKKPCNLAVFHALLSVLSVAFLIPAVTILLILRNEILPSSSDFEKTVGILNIAVPVIIINVILIITMVLSIKFTSDVSGKSALAFIQREINLVKFTVTDLSCRVNRKASGTEGLEELVEQLKLFSLYLNETVKLALRIKEKTELFTQEVELGKKRQNGDFLSLPITSCYSDAFSEITRNRASKVVVNPLREIFAKQTLEEFLSTCDSPQARSDVQEAIETATSEKQMGRKSTYSEILEGEITAKEAGMEAVDAESCAGVSRTLLDDSNGAPEMKEN